MAIKYQSSGIYQVGC